MRTTVGVIFGCPSVEHEVSVVSAIQAINSLDEDKYDIFPMYISKEGEWYWGEYLFDIDNYRDLDDLTQHCERILLSPNRQDGTVFVYPGSFFSKRPLAVIDVFLPIAHGYLGEDGSLQGFLEMTGIPYVGPSVLSSALGMDKVTQKAVCKMGGIPVLDCFWFYGSQWSDGEDDIIAYIENKFNYPMIVKPSNLGSSIGVAVAYNREELTDAIVNAGLYSPKILVEHAISHRREFNIAVLGDGSYSEFSSIAEVPSENSILSFEDKYVDEGQDDSEPEEDIFDLGAVIGNDGDEELTEDDPVPENDPDNSDDSNYSDDSEEIEIAEDMSAEDYIDSDEYDYSDSCAESDDFGNTESSSSRKQIIPAILDTELKKQIENYALDAFYCMDGNGAWRFDFIYDQDDQKLYLNEVNTIPGSLAYRLWEAKGVPFSRLLDRLISNALRKKKRNERIISSFKDNLLANSDFNGHKF